MRALGGQLLQARETIKQTSIQAERQHGDNADAHNAAVADTARTVDAALPAYTENATVNSARVAAAKYRKNVEAKAAGDKDEATRAAFTDRYTTFTREAAQAREKAEQARLDGDTAEADRLDRAATDYTQAAQATVTDARAAGIQLEPATGVGGGGGGDHLVADKTRVAKVKAGKGSSGIVEMAEDPSIQTVADSPNRKDSDAAVRRDLKAVQNLASGPTALAALTRDAQGNFMIGNLKFSPETFDLLAFALSATPKTLRQIFSVIPKQRNLGTDQKIYLTKLARRAARNPGALSELDSRWASWVMRRHLSDAAAQAKRESDDAKKAALGAGVLRFGIKRRQSQPARRRRRIFAELTRKIDRAIGEKPAYASLDPTEARVWYNQAIQRLRSATDENMKIVQRARFVHLARNTARSIARRAMHDRAFAWYLMVRYSNRTFSQHIGRTMRKYNLSKKEAIKRTAESAFRTNQRFNKRFGVKDGQE